MSDLGTVTEILENDCFCHSNDLKFVFECMPTSIFQGELQSDCDGNVYCFHKKADLIKEKLQQFKTFLETKSKFKIGDRIELSETPEITAKVGWGWLDSKHFLIEGAKATIQEISYYKGQFGYSIIVDNESWLDSKGILHPRSDKKCQIPGCGFTHKVHTFYFREYQLRPTDHKPCEFLKRLWNDFYRIGD